MDDIKIVFKAIIGDVVEGAKKVLSVFKNTKSSIESNPIRINTEEDFKSAENSLKKLEDEFKEIGKSIASTWDKIQENDANGIDTTEMTQAYDEMAEKSMVLEKRIKSIKDAMQEFMERKPEPIDPIPEPPNEDFEETANIFERIAAGTKGITKDIIKIGLRLMGIQSLLSFVSKIFNSAVADNKELGYTFTAITKTLAEILMPVIKWLADGMKRILIALNSFLYGLTGINFLEKAMGRAEKSAKGMAKAIKSLAGFDEINNIGQQTNASDNWYNSISFGNEMYEWWINLGVKVKGIVDSIAEYWNTKLKPKLEPVFKWLADFWRDTLSPAIKAFFDWFGENWEWFIPTVLLGLGVIEVAVGLLTGNIGSMVKGLGLIILGGLVTADEATKEATGEMAGYYAESNASIGRSFDGIANNGRDSANSIADSFGESSEGIDKTFASMGIGIGDIFGDVSADADTNADLISHAFGGAWETIKQKASEKLKPIKDGFIEMTNGIIGGIESFVNFAIKGINWLIRAINKIKIDIPSWVPLIGGKTFSPNIKEVEKITLGRIEQYDVGTNYVPNDQLAMVHKGEAIIPAKYNAGGYDSGTDMTNQLLEDLITAVQGIEVNPYIKVADIGKAVDKYNTSKSRQLGMAV